MLISYVCFSFVLHKLCVGAVSINHSTYRQCCGSKYIESESRVLAQFLSGFRVMLSITGMRKK